MKALGNQIFINDFENELKHIINGENLLDENDFFFHFLDNELSFFIGVYISWN